MISVVIVNWNSGPLLERCVDSLLRYGDGCEIIVVDNASRDNSLDLVRRSGADVIVMRNRENVGFSAANNAGWRRSKGEHVLFLNPDTECLPGSIGRLVEPLERDSAVWAAGGTLSNPSGRPQTDFNVRPFPTVASVAAEMFFLDEAWPGNPWTRRYRFPSTAGTSVLDVDQPAAACLMVRREALSSLGGFDESFAPAWFEDVDLCKRIRDRGGRIVLQPAARFLHHGGFSVERLGYEDFLRHYRTNQIRYFTKHHGERAARRVKALVGAGMFLRGAVCIVFPLAGNSSRLAAARIFWRAGCHFGFGRDIGS